jgi:F-type H+-transporting ATPase subunit delta|tara:strand:+ start:85 stop:621 length:537 start_codon:yes stop_codon:yes gene_type:complete
MIELSPLARPYAKAIFAAALDAGNHEMVARDLALLSAVSNTKEVSSLIEDPELSKEKIAQIIIGLADGEICDLSNKMLELLADNKRLNLIEAINTSYQQLLEQHSNTSSIVVNVANQPSEDNKNIIIEKLLAEHGEGSNIEFSEDPSIMGGLSIKVGDETLDLSIKGKVKKLVNQLNF